MVTIFALGPNLEKSVEQLYKYAKAIEKDAKGYVHPEILRNEFLDNEVFEWNFYLTDDPISDQDNIPVYTEDGKTGNKNIVLENDFGHGQAYINQKEDNDWQFSGLDALRGYKVLADGKEQIAHYIHKSSKPFEQLKNSEHRKNKVLYKTFHNAMQYQQNKVFRDSELSRGIKNSANDERDFQKRLEALDNHTRLSNMLNSAINKVYGQYLTGEREFHWSFSDKPATTDLYQETQDTQ